MYQVRRDDPLTQPYLVSRAELREWRRDESYARAAEWLKACQKAIAFGFDDDEIRVAFGDIFAAGEWMKDMLRDEG